jgi:Winged helix-turn helix
MPLLVLTEEQRMALERHRDTAAKPHERERAAALLKVAAGISPAQVAREGLLRQRKRTTVYSWVRRFRKEGLAALSVRPGRGRKPAFSPAALATRGGQASDLARDPTGSASVRDRPRPLATDRPARRV